MTTAKCIYKDLTDFLSKHKRGDDKTLTPTHTRIASREHNVYGGCYHIPEEEMSTFNALYYESVFVKKKPEYLTEKQNTESGPCLVDFDFRYDLGVTTRQHNLEEIMDMLYLYLEVVKSLLVFEADKPFLVAILEKPHVNPLLEEGVTKDGIHMLIGIDMDRVVQIMLREKIVEGIPEIWGHLPLVNTWDKVLDEGITKGTTNWQMFGSKKPGNETYEVTKLFEISYDSADGEFMMDELTFDMAHDWTKLSAQYKQHPSFPIHPNPKVQAEYNRIKKGTKKSAKKKTPTLEDGETKSQETAESVQSDAEEPIPIEDIVDKETLEKAVDIFLKSVKTSEYHIKEIHEYTQILPEKYYEPGSHLLNRQVAFALKNTDERLFLSWIMLRSKASDFDYSTIPELHNTWKKHFHAKKEGGVTKKSIIYWAKQDAFDEYMRVKKSTVDNYIEESLTTGTEFDCAMVLYQMFKDKYVCTNIQNKKWYVFKRHRWVPDEGFTLRLAISRDMYNIYQDKIDSYNNELQKYESTDDRYEYIKTKMKYITSVSLKFKHTTDKNNIMREAMELFFDREFITNMDSNWHLMCFSNGVVDFKNRVFRDGYPQDYITKTTGIPYTPFDDTHPATRAESEEIITFMEQLFPVKELNAYMWSHLASCLIGGNLNQTFNVYRGSGSNGKSKLIDLMSHSLGQYKGTVPITLVTEKRGSLGGTCSEVIALKGVRYAVMQESSKDLVLNEGPMKELTGGDPIQARDLYSPSEVFIPQFTLIACTNNLFDINSNDDGTWRRFRICDFMSKFIDENEQHTDATPYVFPKDKTLEDKLKRWAPTFASMLVKLAYENQGRVEDCDIVKASTNRYRNSQDHISAFVSEMISKTNNKDDRIRKTELTNEFRQWFINSQGTSKKIPKGVELYDYMEKKFGKCRSTGWHGVRILYPDLSEAIDDI